MSNAIADGEEVDQALVLQGRGALGVGERNDEMWDEEDEFFYDVLRFPDGSATRLKVRSIVGLLPNRLGADDYVA